jgi:hypothetical protein
LPATLSEAGALVEAARFTAIAASAALCVGAGNGPRPDIIGDTAACSLRTARVSVVAAGAVSPAAAARAGGLASAFAVLTADGAGREATWVAGSFFTCFADEEPFRTYTVMTEDRPTSPYLS